MATCNVPSLLNDASGFLALTEKQLDIATVALLQQWAGDSSTPGELLNAARCINALQTKQIDLIQTQLLCDIAG